MDNSEVVKTLGDLADVSRDGEMGFRVAAEAAQNSNLKNVLEKASARCAEGARELDRAIANNGGEPSSDGTVSGALHRAWTNIKSVVTGGDDYAILVECERGEDVAKAAYESALQQELPMDVARIVRRQYQGVKENHDLIRDLRNAAKAA